MSSNAYQKNLRSRSEKLEACAASFAAFLHRAYNNRDVAVNVAADTGINQTTVEKWLAEASLPQAHHLVRLIGVYGPEMLAALIPTKLGWLDEAVQHDKAQRIRADIARLQAELDQTGVL